MDIRPLPAEERAVRRYVEALWLPYHRELEAVVDRHSLAEDVDLVALEVEFRLDQLDSERHEIWIAIDGDGEFAGFVTIEVDESPPVFDGPDELLVGDVYVREPYRATGLARELIDRAGDRARELGCAALTLEVDADNDRAFGFYDKLGFEPSRHRLVAPLDDP
ncbi:GNAT family N-acetyltransferase [Natronobeatus ordinarius]|uniref:GNAT family N-acetyltransferase n=1 Tax=Natronobeatus ordinarius TaxID=2963433 RepID=UPI0020CF1CF2|nr:GNAT family N-acetyltransferase [Natronobeatus ordinarius]